MVYVKTVRKHSENFKSEKGEQMSRSRRRKFAGFCALLIFLFLLFSVLFLVKEADHDCTSADCPICAEMQQCEASIRLLGAGHPASALSVKFDFTSIQILWAPSPVFFIFSTLVSEQIRMND
jgi:hypothetical protein